VCPGVSESRPNVRRNDTVSVITNGVQYDGYAHRVEMESLKLRFDQSLYESVKTSPQQVKVFDESLQQQCIHSARVVPHALSLSQTDPEVSVCAQEFSVRFSFSRLQMRVQHQAIKLVMQPNGLGAEVLLPTKEVSSGL